MNIRLEMDYNNNNMTTHAFQVWPMVLSKAIAATFHLIQNIFFYYVEFITSTTSCMYDNLQM